MENKKVLKFIDGIDCTGKSTLWKKNAFSGLSVRGPLSNLAYALKYDRSAQDIITNIKEMTEKFKVKIYHLDLGLKTWTNYVQTRAIQTGVVDDLDYDDFKYFDKAKELIRALCEDIEILSISHNTFEILDENTDKININDGDGLNGLVFADWDKDSFELLAKEDNKKYQHTKIYVYVEKEENDEIDEESKYEIFTNALENNNSFINLINVFKNYIDKETIYDKVYNAYIEHTDDLYNEETLEEVLEYVDFTLDLDVRINYSDTYNGTFNLSDIYGSKNDKLEDFVYGNSYYGGVISEFSDDVIDMIIEDARDTVSIDDISVRL